VSHAATVNKELALQWRCRCMAGCGSYQKSLFDVARWAICNQCNMQETITQALRACWQCTAAQRWMNVYFLLLLLRPVY
jgi:hypothetical protein